MDISIADFEEQVLNSEIPVVVDFWATWCGPCRMVAPVISALQKEYEGRVKVVKVNVDAEPALSEEYQVFSIPTIYVFKNKKVVSKFIGAGPKATYDKMIKEALSE